MADEGRDQGRDDGAPAGLLAWLRKGTSTSSGGAGGALGVIGDLFSPGAARAREEVEREHEMALPAPTPGDKLLSEGRITIRRPAAGTNEDG